MYRNPFLSAYPVEREILCTPEAHQNVDFSYLEISKTILEIKYAAPLAVNGIMRCDLGF
jgi:hypothetical protein